MSGRIAIVPAVAGAVPFTVTVTGSACTAADVRCGPMSTDACMVQPHAVGDCLVDVALAGGVRFTTDVHVGSFGGCCTGVLTADPAEIDLPRAESDAGGD